MEEEGKVSSPWKLTDIHNKERSWNYIIDLPYKNFHPFSTHWVVRQAWMICCLNPCVHAFEPVDCPSSSALDWVEKTAGED